MDLKNIKANMLEVIKKLETSGGSLQTRAVLDGTYTRLRGGDRSHDSLPVDYYSAQNEASEEAILTVYYDLFRTGHLAWGLNFANEEAPWFHLTEKGRRALQHLSRDPYNPDGYMAYLKSSASINPIAESYINEAVFAFNDDFFKSSAVMLGCASEALLLELRDVLVAKMQLLNKKVPENLGDWRIKRVLDAFETEIKSKLPGKLKEVFEGHWASFTTEIRMTRNEVGHPNSIEPVEEEVVHGSLLIFPQIAILYSQLKEWINTSYK